jgi:hypothetical protein
MLILTSCGPKARIVGEVRDGFGNPLSDVEVSIPGTALKTTSNRRGEYSITYVPGRFTVMELGSETHLLARADTLMLRFARIFSVLNVFQNQYFPLKYSSRPFHAS